MALEYKDAGTVGSKRGAKDGARHMAQAKGR